MAWNTIIGQEYVKSLLRSSLERGELAHAYLFYGLEGVGKDAAALELGRAINCLKQNSEGCGECSSCVKISKLEHPDVQLVVPFPSAARGDVDEREPGKAFTERQFDEIVSELKKKAADPYYHVEIQKASTIKIDQIRAVRRDASLTASEGRKKVFIISGADSMTPEASNALLKTLEEPPESSMFILTTAQKEALLPTIVSRCRAIHFQPLSEHEISAALIARDGAEPEAAALAARLADGSYSRARALADQAALRRRDSTTDFLRGVAVDDTSSLWKRIEELATSRDATEVGRWFLSLRHWLRDALFMKSGLRSRLPEDSYRKSLERFTASYPNADLLRAQEAVERAEALLTKNAHLPLVLLHLVIELKASFKERNGTASGTSV